MTTLMMQNSLRKAAILVATLDERAADALLDQMGPEMAARVRNAIMELGDIPPAEQEQVIAEFLGRGEPEITDVGDGVELSPSLMEQLRDKEVTDSLAPRQETVTTGARSTRPFASLEHVEPVALARALEGEHVQTIAVVLAHLQPEQVAEILARLPSETSIEALARMARIDDLAPEVLDDIERELLARVPRYSTNWLKPEGVANIQAVLDVLDETRRKELLGSLERKDVRLLRRLGYVPSGERPFADVEPPAKGAELAATLSRISTSRINMSTGSTHAPRASRAIEAAAETQPSVDLASNPAQLDRRDADQALKRDVSVAFDQFGLLNDRALRRIVEEADARVVEIALTGADSQLVRRVLRLVPARTAADWRQRIERPGPLRLRDIELARHLLERLASVLARRGEITLPRSRFAAAA